MLLLSEQGHSYKSSRGQQMSAIGVILSVTMIQTSARLLALLSLLQPAA